MARFRPPEFIIAAKTATLLLVAALFALSACGKEPEREATAPAAAGTPSTAEPPPDDRGVVLVVGTSLTAGLGVDPSEAYPARLQEKIDDAFLPFRVVAAGVSGETSAGALRRMDWLMKQRVAVLVLETGANDGLRGQDPDATRANIEAIFARAREQQPPPGLILVAMEALPNYGEDYRRRFRAVYQDVAKASDVALAPFLLEGVAGDPKLNQADGIHPTPEGHRVVADNVWKALGPLLHEMASR